MTSQRTTQDQLHRAARQSPRRNTYTDTAGPEDIAAVRSGLSDARTQMNNGDYAAASATLREINTNHQMGFFGNGRLGQPGFNASQTMQQQAEFCRDMETRLGRDVSCPPSEADTQAYFATYNNARERPQARQEFQRYGSAFYTHAGNVGATDSDVVYSRDRLQYVRDGEVFDSAAAAGRGDSVSRVQTAVPDRWSEVAGGRRGNMRAGNGAHTGRNIIDCEGYAYLSGRLLGPDGAGYNVTHVTAAERSITGQGDASNLHAMTRLDDPDSDLAFTQSNAETTYDTNHAAYRSVLTPAQRNDLGRDNVYFEADTMRRSQALAAAPARRRRFRLGR